MSTKWLVVSFHVAAVLTKGNLNEIFHALNCAIQPFMEGTSLIMASLCRSFSLDLPGLTLEMSSETLFYLS